MSGPKEEVIRPAIKKRAIFDRGQRCGPRGQVYQCILETSWPLKKAFFAARKRKDAVEVSARSSRLLLFFYYFSSSSSSLTLFFSSEHHPLLLYALCSLVRFSLARSMARSTALHSLKYAARCELV